MMLKKIILPLVFILGFTYVQAQDRHVQDITRISLLEEPEKAPDNWYRLDSQADHFKGVSSDKAYAELLKDKKTKTVIVAIIDSGIDIEHEDLKDNIWVNPGEVAGNGIDDDKNGYIDDVNGWNFIGNTKGEMIDNDNLEVTRLYVKYKKQYEGKSASDFKGKKLVAFNEYVKIKEDFESRVNKANATLANIEGFVAAINSADSTMKAELQKDDYTMEEVNAFKSDKEDVKKAQQLLAYIAMMKISTEDMQEGVDYYKDQLAYNLNPEFEPRALVGDDYSNVKEKYYGNNKVEGPDAMHGTHVAGIIAAVRNNGIGMDGIAGDVKIMVVRTVPNGDERDKDVANSIYYAVNNGAQIINMSFGKNYSPYKKQVDKAMKYAAKKGVLLVHAAGNDANDNDLGGNYPAATYLNGKKCPTWVEIGASSWEEKGNFVADFSNYGKKTVDVFAPGVQIYSTIPDDKYKNLQGTSMASPVVAGVAALVLSYYPNLTAVQLKEILMKSATNYGSSEVNLPGEKKKVKFEELSQTGGIVNAYEALKMAESMSK